MADANPTPTPAPSPAPAPATPTASQGTAQPAGSTPGTGAPPPPQDQWGGMLFPLMAMAILFYLFIIRPETRRKKEKDAVMNSLKVKDEVVTIFGLYGTVVSIDGDDVVLLVDPKKEIKMRFRRAAIDSVVTKEEKK